MKPIRALTLLLAFSWNAAQAQTASSPQLPLARLLGEWTVVESSFSTPDGATKATFVATPAAGGTAVYSVWRQGTGAAKYEANAVWSHHAGTGVVRVFEVNSLGAADTHTGRFLGSDSLQLELRDAGAPSPTQRRLFVWSADTLRMTAQFSQNDRIVDHAIVLVRRPSLDASHELQAVRAVWDEASAAFAAKDWERYARTWSQEPSLQVIHPPTRGWLVGWDAFERSYRAIFASNAKWTFETRRFDAQLSPSGDAAWVTIENVLTLDGVRQTAWQVVVFKKIEGQWKMVLGFSAPIPAASR